MNESNEKCKLQFTSVFTPHGACMIPENYSTKVFVILTEVEIICKVVWAVVIVFEICPPLFQGQIIVLPSLFREHFGLVIRREYLLEMRTDL